MALAFQSDKIDILNQVTRGGRFIAPIYEEGDDNLQYIWVIDKLVDGSYTKERTIKETYVILQSSKNQVDSGKSNVYYNSE